LKDKGIKIQISETKALQQGINLAFILYAVKDGA
jgi:hypothetical protein